MSGGIGKNELSTNDDGQQRESALGPAAIVEGASIKALQHAKQRSALVFGGEANPVIPLSH